MTAQYSGLILLIPLVVLITEDFRSHAVTLVWLIVLAALSVAVSLYTNGLWKMLANVASNLFLLLYMGIGILIYIRIRRRRWINPLREHIGSGDVVFLAAITPLFDLYGYLLFLICAFVFSLLWVAVIRRARGSMRTIPLAATTGIALCVTIIINIFQ